MAILQERSNDFEGRRHTESGNSKQFGKILALLYTSAYSNPFESIFHAEHFDIWFMRAGR